MERVAVVFRPQALADIEAIFLFVLERSQSFKTASGFTDRIFDRCERIGNVPRGGVAREDLGLASASSPLREVPPFSIVWKPRPW